MTSSVKLSSRTWTLRFKQHRTTILLHVDPLQKMGLVRAELLKALQQSHPDGHLNGHVIPQNADDLLFARPVDINDLEAGWEAIDKQHDLEEDAFEDKGKGKGKAAASTAGGSGKSKGKSANSLQDCPQGMGLRDGGVVAFKFRSEDDAMAGDSHDEGVEDMEKLDGETLVDEQASEKWDVVLPNLEEVYDTIEGDGDEEMLPPSKLM